MKNNEGMTLVELLVAFAVSAIVLASIATIIFACLRMYGRTSANLEIQNEAQTAINLITDNVMGAKGICMKVPASGENTKCIPFNPILILKVGSDYNAYYKGTALLTNIEGLDSNGNPTEEIYLADFPNDDYAADYSYDGENYCTLITGAVSEETAAALAFARLEDYRLTLDREMWLLSKHVTSCVVEPVRTTDFFVDTIYYEGGATEKINYFKEPLTLRVSLAYDKDYGKAQVMGNLEDEVSVRSRLKSVFIDDGSGMKKYMREQ